MGYTELGLNADVVLLEFLAAQAALDLSQISNLFTNLWSAQDVRPSGNSDFSQSASSLPMWVSRAGSLSLDRVGGAQFCFSYKNVSWY
jgi:hypothetical protein